MIASGQLTFTSMGGATVAVPVRGKHYTQAKGYAAPPGTGPAGHTCGDCLHLCRNKLRSGRTFPKCGLRHTTWTGGRGTDVLVRAPACRKWEASP